MVLGIHVLFLTMRFQFSIYIYYRIILIIFSFFFFFFGLYLININQIFILEWNFLNMGGCDIIFPLILDKYGLLFSSVVLFISSNVLIFSNYYISEELFNKRFLYLVVLFILSINFLIFIPHLIGLLLGWDGLGLVSFVLVIYYQNKKSLGAGLITAIRNRIGDVFLLLSIGWVLSQGHWIILLIWDNYYSLFIIFRISVAAITKRAQIPFSSWLPAAIAAPTPVRALVHSSTLVTAGVFLLIRFYPFLSSIKIFNFWILIFSSLTIFMAGIRALVERDIKKIVALSTLRQLGVIISSIGLGLFNLAFFHLITHALFKALLFICVGTLIHLHHHRQDLRNFGNLFNQLPLTTSCINIANMALCGLPFISGFYSKDLIIEITLYNNYRMIILFLFFWGTIITASYSIRLIITGIISINLSFSMQYISENYKNNTWPIIMLSIGGIFRGCLINWLFLRPILEPIISHSIKTSAFIITVLGGGFIYFIILCLSSLPKNIKLLHNSSSIIWFLVPISTQIILKFPFRFGKNRLKIIDQGWVEILGAQGLFLYLHKIFNKYQNIHNSIIINYITLISLAFILFFMLYFNSLTISVALKLLRWYFILKYNIFYLYMDICIYNVYIYIYIYKLFIV